MTSVRAILCGLLLLLSSVARAVERPNIIFFLSDDHRAGFLGCAGHPIIKTPNIDRLARDGVRFENTFVTTAICAASRATLLTGLVERTHKYTFGTPPIAVEYTQASYPAVLKRAGYRTGFVGKFGVGVEKGQPQVMFDYFQEVGRSPYFKPQPDGTLRHETEIDGDKAIEFLLSQPKDKPFCLSVSFNASHAEDADRVKHYPWIPAMDGLYDDAYIPPPRLASNDIFEAHPQFLKESMNRDRWFWRWDTPEKYQHNIRGYYRQISGIDFTIGRVLREVERLGLSENTVVIFSGDNGYYAAERQFAGKWSHFDQSQRVPLVIFDPRVNHDLAGRVLPPMVLNLDIAPTIVDLGGAKIPQYYQGRSLRPWLDGQQPKVWRSDFFCEHLMVNADIPKWEGVRTERYVYARYFEQQPPFEFLHDLKDDPDQLKNLVNEPTAQPQLVELRARTIALRDSYGGEYSLEQFPSGRQAGTDKARRPSKNKD
ncbi:MAG: sulfatase [Planctomycetaceae bacterium]